MLEHHSRAALAALIWLPCAVLASDGHRARRELIVRGDLHYTGAVARSEDGLPLGNGRMGSLFWTTPTSLRLQVNRVDVQPISSATTSFFERNSDYMGGCGFADIDLGPAGADVFRHEDCPQHLSIYDGALAIAGDGVAVRAVALPDPDVFAIELDDRRAEPQPLAVHLRMLRYVSPYSAGPLEKMIRDV